MSKASLSPVIPRATYRLQFHRGFGFVDATKLAAYLSQLGISHVYASPYLKSRPGSTHGYDIVDHTQLNPELGTESDFLNMVAAFRENGLNQVLDIVPNHMAVGGSDNRWWLDVLEWGEDSQYSGWFDIEWNPDRRYLEGKLLVPFLGEQYGAVLEAGHLELRFDAEHGTLAVWAYNSHKLPICPLHYHRILGDRHPDLERMGDAFSGLLNWRPRVAARARELQIELARLVEREDVRASLDEAVTNFNGRAGSFDTWRNLDALINQQHWRAAHFRVASDDINYRRFFNINELAGLRIELAELFDHAHSKIFELVQNGSIEGLRIDHVDGLFDPKNYLRSVREKSPRPCYLVVEKILARHEALREDWPVEGTTGYDFANAVLGLLLDPAGEDALTNIYRGFVAERFDFAEVVRECKRRIMLNEMASELNVLARDAARIARQNAHTADFTRNILQRALKEVIACFPVYRTYLDNDASPSDADTRDIAWALAQARRFETDLDPSVFDFLHKLLTTDLIGTPRNGFSRHSVVRFAMRVQQYSGPVMAKGLEDTAFYRYNRLIALNEVGGHPDHFGLSVSAFHRANLERAKRWPHAMLATATHDTKRGEDTRARLAVLSEIPEDWEQQVQAWSRILRARRGDLEGVAPPSRNDEYLFYQLLLGAWPAELSGQLQPKSLSRFAERVEAAMIKSIREAKVNTSWSAPNADYEDGVLSFVRDALDNNSASAFLAAFMPFQDRVARLGINNSLIQTVLKLTVPGVPDLYQGSELWDLSLVDPDNRREVDYRTRVRLLREVKAALDSDRRAAVQAMKKSWNDGRIKMAVISTLLAHRAEQPALFEGGAYEPLLNGGDKAEEIFGFARACEAAKLLVVATRFPARTEFKNDWTENTISLPCWAAEPRQWRDLLTGRLIASNSISNVGTLLTDLPVAALVPYH